jgi:thymidylate synthase (FAD)
MAMSCDSRDGMVKLVWITPDPQDKVMYCARVSSPHRQDCGDVRLLDYCIRHGHWSPFEMASMCLEINTTRAISAQIIRHRSFHFQEFSQRYAEVPDAPVVPRHRIKGDTNRQGSIEAELTSKQRAVTERAEMLVDRIWDTYKEMIDVGIAAETARNVLPMCCNTRLYMAGTIRDWLHYTAVRIQQDTQLEHRVIAEAVRDILSKEMPAIWSSYARVWLDKHEKK